MDTLTIAIVCGVILLMVLIGVIISRTRTRPTDAITSMRLSDDVLRRKSAAAPVRLSPSRKADSILTSPAVETRIAVTETQISAHLLEAKLLLRFSGNQDVMKRNVRFEKERNPHLDETALMEKMLYDLERGR